MSRLERIQVRGLVALVALGFVVSFTLADRFARAGIPILSELVLYGLPLAWIAWKRRTAGLELGRVFAGRAGVRDLALAGAAAILLAALGLGLLLVLPYIVSQVAGGLYPRVGEALSQFRLQAVRPYPLPVFVLMAVAVGPLVEEMIFRGVILRRWIGKWGTAGGVLGSSALFGVLHGPGFLSATVIGLIAAALCLRTRTLWTAIAFHGLYNGLSLLNLTLVQRQPWPETPAELRARLLLGLAFWVLALAGGAFLLLRERASLRRPARGY